MARTGKTEKMSVTVRKELAAELRTIASHGEISSLVTEALEYHLAHRRQKDAVEKGFGAWKDADYPELATPEDSSKYVREIREADRERQRRLEAELDR
jgi:hypothetical protein